MRLIQVIAAALLLTAALAGPVLAGGPILVDLSVLKTDSPDPVASGSNITYTITAQNLGPGTAAFVDVLDMTPTGTTFVSATAPAGWSTFDPGVGGTGQVGASNPSLTAAAGAQVITLVVQVDPATPDGTVISNTATITSEMTDTNQANNSATASSTVGVAPTPAPTPVASLADAAMPGPSGGSPIAILGFAALLAGALSAAAVLRVRRVRT